MRKSEIFKREFSFFCGRGGWGCNRLLDQNLLNLNVIRDNPKIFMGYSDLTGLITAFHEELDLITFHGPMGLDDWTNDNGYWFEKLLMKKGTKKKNKIIVSQASLIFPRFQH